MTTVSSPSSILENLRESKDYRLGILNFDRPEPIESTFRKVFSDPTKIEFIEAPEELVENPDQYQNTVGLFKDGQLIETTPLKDLQKYTLLVEPDAYAEGIIDVEDIEFPSILGDLDETRFEVHSDNKVGTKNKIPLILMSRYIEYTALQNEEGTLRTGFQEFERIQDEFGTGELYRKLAMKPKLDVNLYAKPSEYNPSRTMSVKTHTGNTDIYRYTWFVIYQDPNQEKSAAVLCNQESQSKWTGFWTFDQEKVDEIEEMIVYNA